MQRVLKRDVFHRCLRSLKRFPAVAILGPRQCGKSTLAKIILKQFTRTSYLDLERPSDKNKLRDPEAFLSLNRGKLLCLDEIQRVPELFPVLRSFIDENGSHGQFLILGSASRDLIRQSSESLAGRIAHIELTPFLATETFENKGKDQKRLRKLWLRGGFPRSYLAVDDASSFEWRLEFTRTFLERDIPQLGFRIPTVSLDRLLTMCAHNHGQILNSSHFGGALGCSHHTVRSHIDLLAKTFLVRILLPFLPNLKKRLIKSPKVYIRDSGLLHFLLNIRTQDDLLGHPVYGASWEGLVVENILPRLIPGVNYGFYRSAGGAEIDLILEGNGKRLAVECKASLYPEVRKGFWVALSDLNVTKAWIIAPVEDSYPLEKNVVVSPLDYFLTELEQIKFLNY